MASRAMPGREEKKEYRMLRNHRAIKWIIFRVRTCGIFAISFFIEFYHWFPPFRYGVKVVQSAGVSAELLHGTGPKIQQEKV